MTVIAKRRAIAPAFLATSCVGALMCPAFAAEAPAASPAASSAADQQVERQDIIVTGAVYEDELVNPKNTAPLLDTPQTVTIVSDQVIRKQNLLTLRDVLSTVPGITFGAGEGGGGYGDSINLRGYSANNDITLDGVRDSAQYSRTDPFNTQQIEVYNGANSVYNGSGSVGGTINLVSKAPKEESLTILEAGIGTDDYYRATLDTNQRVSDLIAVRLNAMFHRNDVPGRDVEKYERWGVAPSVTIGVGGPTSLTLAYVHQKDDNTPIYGVPFVKNEINDGPLPGVDSSDYFGIRNLDEQETTIDRLTAIFAHQFSEGVSIRNLGRYQRVHQYSQTSAPQGTFCLASGVQPITAANLTSAAACPGTLAAGFYRPSGPRGLVRDQINDLLFNQTDLRIVSGDKEGVRNTLVIGASYAQEDYSIGNAQLLRNPLGVGPNPTLPDISLSNPNTVWTGPVNKVLTGTSYGDSHTAAVYAFDTLELGMFELNAGLRYENAKGTFRADTITAAGTNGPFTVYTRGVDQVSDENLFSYRFGGVFKPVESVSIYAAYANSKTPSSATVRLGCGTVVTSPNGVYDPCAVAPEKARSYEVGVKAAFMEGKLQATAALFRNERSNYRVPSNDPALPTSLQILDGRSRVDGLALGLTGNVTPEWTLFANYTYLKSKVVQSVSDFCLNAPASTGCLNSVAIPDPAAGDELIQTPKHSGSLYTSYRLPFGLEVGYGLTYQGSFALNQSVLANMRQFRSKDYLVQRAFLSYSFFEGLTAQLNVQNLFDKKYYTGIRNNITAATGVVGGGWATPGEGRSGRLSIFYSF
jgi:catecholate siderophore receptor